MLLFLSLLALSFPIDGPGHTPIDAKACAAQGGKVRPVCLSGTPMCVVPFRDAGKRCTGDRQCEGRCMLNGAPPKNPKTKVVGRCEANNNPCGCYTTVENGRVARSLCVD